MGGRSKPSIADGARIKAWRVVRCLGTGSMGEVYEAKHEPTGRRVAVKVMRQGIDAQFNAERRLLEEARAASAIHHPGIVDVLDVGLYQERPFIVMELLEGVSLAVQLKRGRLTRDDALGVLEQILGAIDAAHRAGVVHRDLKPSNVFLLGPPGAWSVKLLDFGVARREGRTELLTGPAMAVGTMGYMAPEQLLGAATPASDLYAVGCLAFQMLSGRLVFPIKNIPENARLHLSEPPPKLRAVGADVSEALEAFVDDLLAKKPEDRPASAGLALIRLRAVTGRSEKVEPRTELVSAYVPHTDSEPTLKESASERTTSTAMRPLEEDPAKTLVED